MPPGAPKSGVALTIARQRRLTPSNQLDLDGLFVVSSSSNGTLATERSTWEKRPQPMTISGSSSGCGTRENKSTFGSRAHAAPTGHGMHLLAFDDERDVGHQSAHLVGRADTNVAWNVDRAVMRMLPQECASTKAGLTFDLATPNMRAAAAE